MGKILSPIITYFLVILLITIPDLSVSYEWELGITVYVFISLWLIRKFRLKHDVLSWNKIIPTFSISIVMLIVWLEVCLSTYLIEFITAGSEHLTAFDDVRKSNGALVTKLPFLDLSFYFSYSGRT